MRRVTPETEYIKAHIMEMKEDSDRGVPLRTIAAEHSLPYNRVLKAFSNRKWAVKNYQRAINLLPDFSPEEQARMDKIERASADRIQEMKLLKLAARVKSANHPYLRGVEAQITNGKSVKDSASKTVETEDEGGQARRGTVLPERISKGLAVQGVYGSGSGYAPHHSALQAVRAFMAHQESRSAMSELSRKARTEQTVQRGSVKKATRAVRI